MCFRWSLIRSMQSFLDTLYSVYLYARRAILAGALYNEDAKHFMVEKTSDNPLNNIDLRTQYRIGCFFTGKNTYDLI